MQFALETGVAKAMDADGVRSDLSSVREQPRCRDRIFMLKSSCSNGRPSPELIYKQRLTNGTERVRGGLLSERQIVKLVDIRPASQDYAEVLCRREKPELGWNGEDEQQRNPVKLCGSRQEMSLRRSNSLPSTSRLVLVPSGTAFELWLETAWC